MGVLSTRISCLKDTLSILKGIEIKLCTASQIKEYGIATCETPKKGCEEHEPFIRVYNGNTNEFYKIALEADPNGTSCIMELIGTKTEVTKENTAMLYCIFTLLHEAGHWYDYKNRPDEYTSDVDAVDNSVFPDSSIDAARAYRKRPIENRADQFALDHIIEAWKEVNEKIFHGLLSVSEI